MDELEEDKDEEDDDEEGEDIIKIKFLIHFD